MVSLKRLGAIWGAFALSIALFATPAIADTPSHLQWPSGCGEDSGYFPNKQAVRLWVDTGYSGAVRSECGDIRAANELPYWRYASDNVHDASFDWDSNVGDISNYNDRASSLVMFNKSTGQGICFAFFSDEPEYYGKVASYWVGPRDPDSKYRYRKVTDIGHSWFSGEDPGDELSSLRAWGGLITITTNNKAACHADTTYPGSLNRGVVGEIPR